MSDRHVRLLRAVAKRRRQEVDRHDDTERGAATEGRHLARIAARAKARLSASEARRRRSSDG